MSAAKRKLMQFCYTPTIFTPTKPTLRIYWVWLFLQPLPQSTIVRQKGPTIPIRVELTVEQRIRLLSATNGWSRLSDRGFICFLLNFLLQVLLFSIIQMWTAARFIPWLSTEGSKGYECSADMLLQNPLSQLWIAVALFNYRVSFEVSIYCAL